MHESLLVEGLVTWVICADEFPIHVETRRTGRDFIEHAFMRCGCIVLQQTQACRLSLVLLAQQVLCRHCNRDTRKFGGKDEKIYIIVLRCPCPQGQRPFLLSLDSFSSSFPAASAESS